MMPVLLHGRVVWDQALFPRDECEERLLAVQSVMAAHGLDCLLVAGAKADFADLCYLTQFVPYAAWALAVVPVEGEITLVTGVGGGRELPASRARTWVSDVRNLANLGPALVDLLFERVPLPPAPSPLAGRGSEFYGEQVPQGPSFSGKSAQVPSSREALERGAPPSDERATGAFVPGASRGSAAPPGQRRLGLVGLETLPVGLERRLRNTLEEHFECVAADELMGGLRAGLRSRELSAVRRAAEIAAAARVEIERAYADGAGNAAAMIAGEREARRRGALDVRTLVNLDGGELAPIEGITAYRSEPLIGYLAVNSLGYWADLAVTAGPVEEQELARARAALRAIAAAARPGATADTLAAAAAASLPDPIGPSQVLGWGNGIGLALAGPPEIVEGNHQRLAQDSVLSVRVRLPAAFVSDVVRVTPAGGVSLWP